MLNLRPRKSILNFIILICFEKSFINLLYSEAQELGELANYLIENSKLPKNISSNIEKYLRDTRIKTSETPEEIIKESINTDYSKEDDIIEVEEEDMLSNDKERYSENYL